MDTQFTFIEVPKRAAQDGKLDRNSAQKVRVEAMRHFRRQQRCAHTSQPHHITKTEIHNGPAILHQMISTFLEANFPTLHARADLRSRTSFLLDLPRQDLFSEPLLRCAAEMVGCSYLAGKSGDPRLSYQATRCHGLALSLLSRYIRGESQPYSQHTALMAIMLLTLRNGASESLHGSEEWMVHYEGATALIKSRGLGEAGLSWPLRKLAIHLRQSTLYIALARRKSPILSPADWLPLIYNPTPESRRGMAVRLFLHGINLARMVEETEKCCCSGMVVSSLSQLVYDLQQLEHDLNETLQDGSAQDPSISPPACSMNNRTMSEALQTRPSPSCNTKTDATTKTLADLAITEGCMMSLVANCTLLRLLHYHPPVADTNSPILNLQNRRQDILQTARDRAWQLCLYAQALSQCRQQGYVDYAYLLSSLAQNFFEEIGADLDAKWCQAIGRANRAHMSRLVSSHQPTLCRMHDLHDGIISLARFTAPLGNY